ncbi:MAG: MBL fold metallo-hydrolase [Oscillospiraceae bacterium]|jgi:hydroxyacylglutathione hydrolase
MKEDFKSETLFERVSGNTWHIRTGGLSMAAYMPSGTDMIMVDCGIGLGDGLIELIRSHGRRVTHMIATHCHVDHIGNAELLQKTFGTKIWLPELESVVCRSDLVLKSNFPFASRRIVTNAFKMHCEPDKTYGPQDRAVDVDGISFGIVQTPGHSVANTCIITPDNVMCLGDTLIGTEELNHSRLIYNLCVDIDIESKKSLRAYDCAAYIACHGGVYYDISELIDENLNAISRTADDIASVIDRKMSVEEIIKAYSEKFGLGGDNFVKCLMIERNIRPFVDYLCDEGRIIPVADKYLAKYAPAGQSV